LHCLLHVKELKITNIELKRQIGDYWKAGNTAVSTKEIRNQ